MSAPLSGPAATPRPAAHRRRGAATRSAQVVVGAHDPVAVVARPDSSQPHQRASPDRAGRAGCGLPEVAVVAALRSTAPAPGANRSMPARTASAAAGNGAMPTQKPRNAPGRLFTTPPRGSGRPTAPPRWRRSTGSNADGASGSGNCQQRLDRRTSSNESSRKPSPTPGTGPGGSRWIWSRAAVGMTREGVHRRAERAQRCQQRGGLLGRQVDRPVDDAQLLAGQERRQLGQRREAQQPDAGRRRVGQSLGPRRVGAQHLSRPGHREHQHAGVDLGQRQHVELQRGDHADVRAGPTHRPEQLRRGGRRRRERIHRRR